MFYWLTICALLVAVGLVAVIGLSSCLRSRSRIAQNRGEEILRLVDLGRKYHREFHRNGIADVFNAIANQACRLE